ncbi:SOS response-associated peptidase family protein [Microbacterium hydrocarbonoxydans]|uniref:SOS response-associated peptidase family protein n=1 Tax=Microbacterium hydrocarbonoxydans TaxID=273678 RepID=UPI00203FD826|nr:SOS response-associated peptidase family protein [Microbacterium hydrocarbonoxydans]MCM3780067.1 SOS response-associated peptidase [Microbacterium hydrocarbonoxydans]
MCASYGLDPRFTDAELLEAADEAVLDGLRGWAQENANETVRPTGKNLRNLNPIVVQPDTAPTLEPAWWGFLVGGEPSKFPSINTRSERLQDRPGGLKTRALVPATSWYEMKKPERVWHEFLVDDGALFGMAAVTQRGRTTDGTWFTCYSIVMRPAPDRLADVHDRMPLLIPASLSHDWLTAEPTREIIDEAIAASEEVSARVTARPRG